MKPFVKWAGGKRRLLSTLDANLPSNFKDIPNVTYIEPFVGGGAMLFHALSNYPNIGRVIINDINKNLIKSYIHIKDNPEALASLVDDLFKEYLSSELPEYRERIYYKFRNLYNQEDKPEIEHIALFLFLNRTCFNGLYRENREGKFNVPHGRYKYPSLLDVSFIKQASKALQNTEIYCGDFQNIQDILTAQENIFAYIDPPYRPINKERSIFTQYNSSGFCDEDQIRVKHLCDKIHQLGGLFMVSNSDSQTGNESYFEKLYSEYKINRFTVKRTINPYTTKDNTIGEIIIKNY